MLWLTLNRPRYRNALNVELITALDGALVGAASDDGVGSGGDRGVGAPLLLGPRPGKPRPRPGEALPQGGHHLVRPLRQSRGRRPSWSARTRPICRFPLRWRELPKPLIAMVHGACVAGGLSLVWPADLIVASEDAYFADPVVRMGIPGIEYFAHQYVMSTRIAREFLLVGDRMPAARAYEVGMINRVVPRERLRETTARLAERCAARPRFGDGPRQARPQRRGGPHGPARRDVNRLRTPPGGPRPQRPHLPRPRRRREPPLHRPRTWPRNRQSEISNAENPTKTLPPPLP